MTALPDPDLLDVRWAKALSHPVRVRVLSVLKREESSPSAIAEELGLPIVNVSHHVQVLRKLGIIEQVARRYVRGAVEHRYRLIPQIAMSDEQVAALPAGAARDAVRTTLADIVDHAGRALRAGSFEARADWNVSWVGLELDEDGWRAVATALDETLALALAEQERSRIRAAAGAEPLIGARLAVLHYPMPPASEES